MYGLDTAVITGSSDGRTTIMGFEATLNNVVTVFFSESPKTGML
jgi:hypothetical protein